jgi:hypothetical protein
VKEIVTRTKQGEASKVASARRHQGGTVSVAGVIAAKQERLGGKVMSSFHRERTVAGEEHPAKTFKHRTANPRRPEFAALFL